MEDYGNYIYIIVFGIIVISNIVRGIKKTKQKQQNTSNTSAAPPAKTWEDILRELQGELKQTPQPAPVSVKKPQKRPKTETSAHAFVPSMEGQRAIVDAPVVLEEIKEEYMNWTDGFQDLDNVKKAFVMSEILNKKY